jgi:hypothetical protein
MAEFIGHLMANWPTWLIAITVIVFIILAGIVTFYISLSAGSLPFWNAGPHAMPTIRRKKRQKDVL